MLVPFLKENNTSLLLWFVLLFPYYLKNIVWFFHVMHMKHLVTNAKLCVFLVIYKCSFFPLSLIC